jgi:hypothetical protein
MNIDEIMRDMEAFDAEGAEFMTPIQYSKIRPVQAPQVYGWIRTGKISWKRCDCGRKVINVREVDDLLRSKGRLPPVIEDNDEG